MSNETLREVVARLGASTTALAALSAAMQARAAGETPSAPIRAAQDALLDTVGARAALEAASVDELPALLAELRHFWLVDDALVRRPLRTPGWTYDDGELLEAGGPVTQGFAHALGCFAPRLEGLAEALGAPGARFLDVGAGVGALSIALARVFPQLSVVGLEPHAPSFARATRNVANSGVGDRIVVRERTIEASTDAGVFDAAWLPLPFLPPSVQPAALERVRSALKPGGWVFVASARAGTDAKAAALAFRVASWGGQTRPAEEIEAMTRSAGLADACVLPGPPNDFKFVVAARRPR